MLYGSLFFENWTFFLSKIGVCFFENRSLFFWKSEFVFIENQRFFFGKSEFVFENGGSIFGNRTLSSSKIGVCSGKKSEFVFWKSEYWPQILFCLLLLSRNKISGGSRGGARGIRPPPLLLKNRSMFSRCCINFAHELSCQILTNHSIKIGRRAWPTRDHGEQNQNELSSLSVIAGWIFASGVSLKSKCKLCGRNTRRISYQFFKKKLNLTLRSFEN